MGELRKCKCGGKPKVVSEPGMVDYVRCPKCGARTNPYFDGIEYAVYEWNHKGPVWSISPVEEEGR